MGIRDGRFLAACRDGLAAQVGGRALADWARELVAIGRRGLAHCEPDALPLLAPLEAVVADGRSPSVGVIEAWQRAADPAALIRYLQY